MKIKILYVVTLIYCFSFSQSKILKGRVLAEDDLQGINVVNITTKKYAITNEQGFFEINVSLNDTLSISALKFNPVDIKISQAVLNNQILQVQLTEKINQLDEVVIGKELSGDLTKDIKDSGVKAEINFYDLGIPGKTDLPPIIEQRRLNEADAGPLFGLTSVNVHKLLNLISGRTKRLKKQLKIAKQEACLHKMIDDYSEDLFASEKLIDTLKIHFFYYATDDDRFTEICKDSKMKQFEFLIEKIKAFKLHFIKEDED